MCHKNGSCPPVYKSSQDHNSITIFRPMDLQNGRKQPPEEAGGRSSVQPGNKKPVSGIRPALLRASALVATAAAAAVMGLNQQSYTAVVAVVGTTPIRQTFTARSADSPAFVYFVMANAIASLYNLLVLVFRPLLGRKPHSLTLHLLDTVVMVVLATAAAAAAAVAQIGKSGNLHARWNPVCARFGSFCGRAALALAASLAGVALLLALNMLSAAAAARRAPTVAGHGEAVP